MQEDDIMKVTCPSYSSIRLSYRATLELRKKFNRVIKMKPSKNIGGPGSTSNKRVEI